MLGRATLRHISDWSQHTRILSPSNTLVYHPETRPARAPHRHWSVSGQTAWLGCWTGRGWHDADLDTCAWRRVLVSSPTRYWLGRRFGAAVPNRREFWWGEAPLPGGEEKRRCRRDAGASGEERHSRREEGEVRSRQRVAGEARSRRRAAGADCGWQDSGRGEAPPVGGGRGEVPPTGGRLGETPAAQWLEVGSARCNRWVAEETRGSLCAVGEVSHHHWSTSGRLAMGQRWPETRGLWRVAVRSRLVAYSNAPYFYFMLVCSPLSKF